MSNEKMGDEKFKEQMEALRSETVSELELAVIEARNATNRLRNVFLDGSTLRRTEINQLTALISVTEEFTKKVEAILEENGRGEN